MVDNTMPASVRGEINSKFEALPIFKRDRATALYHLCAALEMASNPLISNQDLAMATGRFAFEASMRAIPAIFRNCPTSADLTEVQFNPAVFAEAMQLIKFAFGYEQVMYCFELADRGQLHVHYDPLARRTAFSYVTSDESSADTLLRSHERDSQVESAGEADMANITGLAREAKAEIETTILFVAPDAISYGFTPALLAIARKWAEALTRARRWDFPDDLAVGNMAFGEVHRFWGAVDVLVCVHDLAHLVAAGGKAESRPIASVALSRTRDEWTDLISQVAGIGIGAASELLWWYTFDVNVCEASGPLQPFLAIGPNQLAIPMRLATDSNVERNLQKLLSRHPNLRSFYETVKSAKEGMALTHLSGFFPAPSFSAKPTVKIRGITDADLLVYERASGFVLLVQHKWLIAPETVPESSANDDQLRIGVRQALDAREAFRNDHAAVRMALGLAKDQLVGRVEAVVICRGAEPTGFLGTLPVPVVMEREFEELWRQSRPSLSKLWENLTSRPDHARAASRYRDTSAPLTVGGLDFLVPALSIGVKP